MQELGLWLSCLHAGAGCTGKGVCTDDGFCDCDFWWTGTDCDTSYRTGVISTVVPVGVFLLGLLLWYLLYQRPRLRRLARARVPIIVDTIQYIIFILGHF